MAVDGSRFDSVTRSLAATANRRTALRGLTVGVLAAAGLRHAAAARDMVTICHWNPMTHAYETKTVNPTVVRVHERHPNDIIAPDFTSNENCGGCGIVCAEGERCGAGGEPGVCAVDPGANECPPYMAPNPVSGENPCWFPCSIGGCPKCASGLCIAQADGSAACVVPTGEYSLAWTCSTEYCTTPVQLWDNLSSEQNTPACGAWQEAATCFVGGGTYTLEACPSA